MKLSLLIFFLFCSFVIGPSALAEGPSNVSRDSAGIRQQIKKMQQEMEQSQQEMLEGLKRTDPKRYQIQKVRWDRQKKISQVLKAYRTKKINEEAAEAQLYPLIKALVDEEMQNIDRQIERAKKHLGELQSIKLKPEILLKKRINRLLGRTKPGEDDLMLFLP